MRTVDRSRIPIHIQKQNGPLLETMEKEVIGKLADPEYRWALAIHESAHYRYREKVGAVRLKFVGPHFVYYAEARKVQVVAAGVHSDFDKFVSFRDMACYCVSGYLWEAALTNSKDAAVGADIDKRIFQEDVHRFHPAATEEQIEATWQWAVAEVKLDLENGQIKNQILKIAEEFKRWLCES